MLRSIFPLFLLWLYAHYLMLITTSPPFYFHISLILKLKFSISQILERKNLSINMEMKKSTAKKEDSVTRIYHSLNRHITTLAVSRNIEDLIKNQGLYCT